MTGGKGSVTHLQPSPVPRLCSLILAVCGTHPLSSIWAPFPPGTQAKIRLLLGALWPCLCNPTWYDISLMLCLSPLTLGDKVPQLCACNHTGKEWVGDPPYSYGHHQHDCRYGHHQCFSKRETCLTSIASCSGLDLGEILTSQH